MNAPPEELRRRFWLNVTFTTNNGESAFLRAFLESHGFQQSKTSENHFIFKSEHLEHIQFLCAILEGRPFLAVAVRVQPQCLRCGAFLPFKAEACTCGGPIEPGGVYDAREDKVFFEKRKVGKE